MIDQYFQILHDDIINIVRSITILNDHDNNHQVIRKAYKKLMDDYELLPDIYQECHPSLLLNTVMELIEPVFIEKEGHKAAFLILKAPQAQDDLEFQETVYESLSYAFDGLTQEKYIRRLREDDFENIMERPINKRVFIAKNESLVLSSVKKMSHSNDNGCQTSAEFEEVFGKFLENSGLLQRYFQSLDVVKASDIKERKVQEGFALNHYAEFLVTTPDHTYPETGFIQINMTQMVYEGYDRGKNSNFHLYRHIAWDMKSKLFSDNFLDFFAQDRHITPVEQDEKDKDLIYRRFKNDPVGDQSAQFYAYTKELWFMKRQGYEDNPVMEPMATIFKQAKELYQEIGLIEKADDNPPLYDIAQAVVLHTVPSRRHTEFAFNAKLTDNPIAQEKIYKALKNPQFREKTLRIS